MEGSQPATERPVAIEGEERKERYGQYPDGRRRELTDEEHRLVNASLIASSEPADERPVEEIAEEIGRGTEVFRPLPTEIIEEIAAALRTERERTKAAEAEWNELHRLFVNLSRDHYEIVERAAALEKREIEGVLLRTIELAPRKYFPGPPGPLRNATLDLDSIRKAAEEIHELLRSALAKGA